MLIDMPRAVPANGKEADTRPAGAGGSPGLDANPIAVTCLDCPNSATDVRTRGSELLYLLNVVARETRRVRARNFHRWDGQRRGGASRQQKAYYQQLSAH